MTWLWVLCVMLGIYLLLCFTLGSLVALYGAACYPTARWRVLLVILLSPLWMPLLAESLVRSLREELRRGGRP